MRLEVLVSEVVDGLDSSVRGLASALAKQDAAIVQPRCRKRWHTVVGGLRVKCSTHRCVDAMGDSAGVCTYLNLWFALAQVEVVFVATTSPQAHLSGGDQALTS